MLIGNGELVKRTKQHILLKRELFEQYRTQVLLNFAKILDVLKIVLSISFHPESINLAIFRFLDQ
jgi:hypothetical protein